MNKYYNEKGRVYSICTGFCPWDEFYNHPKGFKGKQSSCKTCVLKAQYRRKGKDYELRGLSMYDLDKIYTPKLWQQEIERKKLENENKL